jgi:hypothetical protein
MANTVTDFFTYAARSHTKTAAANRWQQLLRFVLKDYPAYLWEKPSFGRVWNFPVLLVIVALYGYTQKPGV